MKVFHCDHCGALVFFENTQCVSCGHRLAFLPDLMLVGSLDAADADQERWRSPLSRATHPYRLCANYRDQQVCNWVVDAEDEGALCRSCRLTTVIPDLTVDGNRIAWYRLEVAKRRLLFTLLSLRLPIDDPSSEPLSFQFLADTTRGGPPLLTGHANGVITINTAEADDAERERRRHVLGETYRTLLGHMRHEVGHYYWMRLVDGDQDRVAQFREMFGDERQDYAAALQRHYDNGPPSDWQEQFVTSYASAHPWEDWAETWAHYLHMVDTLETAAACGVSLRPHRSDEPVLSPISVEEVGPEGSFGRLMAGWLPVTYVLNNMNRGLGLPDAYPFVLSPPAIEKLKFVHDTIAGT